MRTKLITLALAAAGILPAIAAAQTNPCSEKSTILIPASGRVIGVSPARCSRGCR